jgi:transposase
MVVTKRSLSTPPWGARGRMSERHTMRKVREVLRLDSLGRSEREIAGAVGIGHTTVGAYLARAEEAGLGWEHAEPLSDGEVEARLFIQVGRNEPATRAPIDLGHVHLELRRAGVTLELLWAEYQQAVADGGSGLRPYQYSRFCELYRAYAKKVSPAMRQTHHAGEKAFIDFSGKRPHLVDRETGARIEVELFVMVLGASNYTYAEATLTQKLPDFVGATVRGLEYFGGVTEMLVPDQLRSAVSRPDWYEPEINATYAELGAHYVTAIVPARPRKPKDKAKVEGGVLIAQRWILACLRNRRFFTLEELNAAIWELLEKLNTRPFQKLEGCRRSAFEKLDRPALRSLPAQRYEVGAWKLGVGVNVDYHFEYDHRYYSVPSVLINAKVDVRATATVLEVWRDHRRVTSHERSYGPPGTAVTKPEHRPRAHREWGEWPPERLLGWAQTKGARTGEVAAAILERGPHPESGRRACLKLMRMGERYGAERLEAACGRALAIGNPTVRSVEAILKKGLEKVALVEEVEAKPVAHENIRGGEYFDRGEVTSSNEEDEIEARYLDEERQSIIHEPKADASEGDTHRRRTDEVRQDGVSQDVANNVVPSAMGTMTEPLSVLIGRAQALLSRPRVVRRIGHRTADGRGGDPIQVGDDSCTSQCACVAIVGSDDGSPHVEDDVSIRQGVYEWMVCKVDEREDAPCGPRRGEVS